MWGGSGLDMHVLEHLGAGCGGGCLHPGLAGPGCFWWVTWQKRGSHVPPVWLPSRLWPTDCNSPGSCPSPKSWNGRLLGRDGAWLSFLLHGGGTACWCSSLREGNLGNRWIMHMESWGGRVYFDCPLFTLLKSWWGESPTLGLWGWMNTWHGTDETDSSLWIPYTHSSGEKKSHTTQGHPEVGCRNRVNKQELREAGFVVTKGRDDPGSPRRMGLAYLNTSVGWRETETHYLGISRCYAWTHDKERCLARRPYLQEQRMGGIWGQAVWGPPGFGCQGSTWPRTLIWSLTHHGIRAHHTSVPVLRKCNTR